VTITKPDSDISPFDPEIRLGGWDIDTSALSGFDAAGPGSVVGPFGRPPEAKAFSLCMSASGALGIPEPRMIGCAQFGSLL
jgi:hypothetical protein